MIRRSAPRTIGAAGQSAPQTIRARSGRAMPDDTLYHTDILAWSRAQAERLRRVAAGEAASPPESR